MEEEEEEDRVEEIKEDETKEEEIKVEETKEHSRGQEKIVTSVVVEKVDENDATQTEVESKDADVDKSPHFRRKPESPLDPDTEKCDDSSKKIAAETVVASEIIEEAAVQIAESPEENEVVTQNSGEDENAKDVMDPDVREVLEEISQDSCHAEQSDGGKIGAEERFQVETSLVSAEEVSEDSEVVKKEESTVEGRSWEREDVKEKTPTKDETKFEESCREREEVKEEDVTFDVTESEGSRDCSQEACLVHQPEIVTDAEEQPAAGKCLSAEKSLVPENENEESVPNEIVDELIENAIESARPTIATDPEPSKSADTFPLEENLGGWEEEDTWEDYDSEFDLEDCRQNRIPAYVEFEIGVWSSALWTSDMKWEKPVVTEAEEVVGWGVPFDHLNNTSSNGTWSSSSSSGDEGARKDTFDESDFCDSPVNGADDSVSTDEGIVASDDEVSEKAVSEKIKKVIVDEPSPLVVNTV